LAGVALFILAGVWQFGVVFRQHLEIEFCREEFSCWFAAWGSARRALPSGLGGGHRSGRQQPCYLGLRVALGGLLLGAAAGGLPTSAAGGRSGLQQRRLGSRASSSTSKIRGTASQRQQKHHHRYADKVLDSLHQLVEKQGN